VCQLKLGPVAEENSPPPVAVKSTIALSFELPAKTGDRIGRYKLLEPLGEGGCGVVYLAEQTEPMRRRVALKVIKPGMDTKEVLARFEAERQALALMDHPNIAKVLDAGATETGRPFFVMELVKGVPITRYCDDAKLSTEQRLKLFVLVCQAIQHAHQKGIIHRDIKPSNILVADHQGMPAPKVIDFGIAKATAGQVLTSKTLFTALEQFIGTPAYMSPEQAKLSGLDVDTRSDIYSLGVLLYELLTARTQFDAKRLIEAGLDEIRRIIREEDPPRPSTRISTLLVSEQTTVARHRQSEPPKLLRVIRGDLDWIVMKTLEKDRNRRYDTANGLANDVQRYLNDEPVLARPPSQAYRVGKLLRRNKLAFVASAAVLAALVLGAAVSAWQAVLARRAEREQSRLRTYAETAREKESELRRVAVAAGLAEARERQRASEITSRLEIQRAEDLFGRDESGRALAMLAGILRANPTNQIAAERLTAALTQRNFPLLQTSPLQHEGQVYAAQFSPDGRWVFTASDDNTARVWDARTGKLVGGPFKHEAEIASVQISPDGRGLLTSSLDNTVGIWAIAAGGANAKFLKHESEVYGATFDPTGKRVFTVTRNGLAQAWDVSSGERTGEPVNLEGMIYLATFSREGKRLAVVSANNTIRVYDLLSSQFLARPLQCTGRVCSVEINPDGKLLAAVSGNEVMLWDLSSGTILHRFTHDGPITSAEFSPEGTRLATCSTDNSARIWDALTGQALTPALRHRATIYTARFSPEGQRLVTASLDHTARVWDARTGMSLSEPLVHDDQVYDARFSPDGQQVVSASRDKTARIWDVRGGASPCLRLGRNLNRSSSNADSGAEPRTNRQSEADTGSFVIVSNLNGLFVFTNQQSIREEGRDVWGIHNLGPQYLRGREFDLAVRPYLGQTMTEQRLRTLLGDILTFGQLKNSPPSAAIIPEQSIESGVLQIWLVDPGTTLSVGMVQGGRVLPPGSIGEGSLAHRASSDVLPQDLPSLGYAQFSTDSLSLLTAEQGVVQIWDSRRPLTEARTQTSGTRSNSFEFSPDGRRVIKIRTDGSAGLYELPGAYLSGFPVFRAASTFSFGNQKIVESKLSYDGNRWVSSSERGQVTVWEMGATNPLGSIKVPTFGHYVELSPTGDRVIIVAADSVARLWHVGGDITELKNDGIVYLAHFSIDGNYLVTASADKTARIWDAHSGRPVIQPLRHQGTVYSARFDQQGGRVVTAAADKTARVWDARTGLPLTQPMTHNGRVYCASFSPDGRCVVTTSEDGSARIWDSSSGLPLTEPLRQDGQVFGAEFSPDGRWIVAVSSGSWQVWEASTPSSQASVWLPDLAEAIGGQKLDEQAVFQPVDPHAILEQRRLASDDHDQDWNASWRQWFFADRFTRSLSVDSRVTVAQYLEKCIAENSLGSLETAERLALGNAVQFEQILKARKKLVDTNKSVNVAK
jgi:WD40 repeat protein/serine/threonine protein kinase